MMISKTLLNKLLGNQTKKAVAVGIFSFVGLLDASYLAIKHYSGTIPPCAIAKGCETVTTSQYATMGGVSVALFGAIYYLIILITSIALIDTGNNFLKKFLSKFSIIGLIASIWFVSLQLFVIKALCLYCIASATSSVAIFTVAFFLNRHRQK